MQDSKNIKQTLDMLLSENDTVFIVPHNRPDFDAIGAAMGMSLICKKNKHIEKYIMDEVHSGATEANVKDGLFSHKKQMLICVVHNANYKEFKHRVLAMDPHAFIVSNNCYEAAGGVRFNLLPF